MVGRYPEEYLTIIRIRVTLALSRFRHGTQKLVRLKHRGDLLGRGHLALAFQKHLQRFGIGIGIPIALGHYSSDLT